MRSRGRKIPVSVEEGKWVSIGRDDLIEKG
jgi:hypothetical protein